jgi:hypothetical protein
MGRDAPGGEACHADQAFPPGYGLLLLLDYFLSFFLCGHENHLRSIVGFEFTEMSKAINVSVA